MRSAHQTHTVLSHHPPQWLLTTFFIVVINTLVPAVYGQQELTAGVQNASTIELTPRVRNQCLAVLRRGLRSDDFWPSIHAAEGMIRAGYDQEVTSYLAPKLEQEQDDQRRCGIARELVRAGAWEYSSVMLSVLGSVDAYGHVHAAESLYKVAEIGDGTLLLKAMQQTSNRRLQLMASAALARCGNPEALKLLRSNLQSGESATIRTAAWVLARVGDKVDIPQLRQQSKSAQDTLTRCFCDHALATLGDPEGASALQDNLSAPDAAVRTYAATFAGDARLLNSKTKLIELLNDAHLDVRIRAAQSLFVLSQPVAPRSESQIVYPATTKNPRYTEGSIIRLRNGSLLYAVTQFAGSGSDFADAQIVAKVSKDHGETWSKPRVLQPSTGSLNVMSVTLRRLQAPHNQTIAMFYLQKNSPTDLRVFVRFSLDEAETFGEPICVTSEPGYHVMNNDRVTQLSTGRIIVPVASTPDVHEVNHFISTCWLSDDAGRTWRKSKGHVDLPKRGAMEPEVVELSSGNLLMLMRTQLGHIAVSRSVDTGETWSKPHQLASLRAPEAPSTIRRIPSTGDLLLIWNNAFEKGAGHGGKRTPLTAALSSDEGKSWRQIKNLESNPQKTFAYVSLTFTKGDAVLSYWEGEGNRLSSRFRRLPVNWFYQAHQSE